MKSFFQKITSDAASFKEKNKKHNFKSQPDYSVPQNDSIPTNGSNIRIENCPNFHFGNTITLITTNVINKEEQVQNKEKKANDSANVIPKTVKDNFSNISQATIEHFEMISSKINDYKNLEKKLGLSEDQFYCSLDGVQTELLVCQMLYSWKKAKTREATVGLLLKILWEAKEYNAAIYLSDNI